MNQTRAKEGDHRVAGQTPVFQEKMAGGESNFGHG